MVAPVSGPFTFNWSRGWPPGYSIPGVQSDFIARTWYRQKAPYDRPLAYVSNGAHCVWQYGSDRSPLAGSPSTASCWISGPTSSSSNAYNNAWSEFNEKCRGQAEWAVTMLQYRQAHDALTKHITNLYNVFRNIKKGRFDLVARTIKPPTGFRPKAKSFASSVLEWRFGWQPLWNDIHESCRSLGRDLGDFTVVGKGRSSWVETHTYDNNGTYAHVREFRRLTYDQRYRLAAEVRIINPNALLWDSLGLTNPALVAYEMIPFSFIANYFFSIEEYVRGLSPFMGLEMVNSHTTHFCTSRGFLQGTVVRQSYPYPNIGPYRVGLSAYTVSRSLGNISGAVLRKRDPWILSPGRAINAIALLTQQLPASRR
jgi:hypothetical protein